jgi:hypothetical protein
MKNRLKNYSPAAQAWMAFGGLMALGLVLLVVREIPSMRRELQMMRM